MYREGVLEGAVDVTKEPESADEAERQFQFKRTMVQGLVKRVDVKSKSTEVTFDVDFTKMPVDLCVTLSLSN